MRPAHAIPEPLWLTPALCRLGHQVVVMPEHLLHGNAPWRPRDRDRRLLALRYNVQHMVVGNYVRYQHNTRPDACQPTRYSAGVCGCRCQGVEHGFPEAVVARLQPETKELASVRQSSNF